MSEMIERTLRVRQVAMPKRVKVLTVGDVKTGKSALIKQYCENRFVSQYLMTIGIDYGVKVVKHNSSMYHLNFWDCSGLPEFTDCRIEFYSDCNVIVLVFDYTCPDSFDNLTSWIGEIRQVVSTLPPIILVGNKADLTGRARKGTVKEKQVAEFLNRFKFPFFKTSASTNEGIQALFDEILNIAEEQTALPSIR
ncbi:hypothetical protein PCE1_003117 [Barthelona sp. PCE]